VSTTQRNDERVIAVDPYLGEILRLQTLVVLEANHEYFEDIATLGAPAQRALVSIYRDAIAVLDALGWAPDPGSGTVDVPLTAGHVEQLRRRRYDLARTNLDRLDTRDGLAVTDAVADLDRKLIADRAAAQGLDALIAAYLQGP